MAKKVPLEPCPFCKGSPKRQAHKFTPDGAVPVRTPDGMNYTYDQKTWYIVKCAECGVSQPKRTYLTREESDAAWNRRA